jgi:hypothetical protein
MAFALAGPHPHGWMRQSHRPRETAIRDLGWPNGGSAVATISQRRPRQDSPTSRERPVPRLSRAEPQLCRGLGSDPGRGIDDDRFRRSERLGRSRDDHPGRASVGSADRPPGRVPRDRDRDTSARRRGRTADGYARSGRPQIHEPRGGWEWAGLPSPFCRREW